MIFILFLINSGFERNSNFTLARSLLLNTTVLLISSLLLFVVVVVISLLVLLVLSSLFILCISKIRTDCRIHPRCKFKY